MANRALWLDLLWGRITIVIASVTLTISTAIGGPQSRLWIFGSTVFIVVHTIVNWTRDQNVVRRLGRDHDRVQRRVLDLVSDLGQIAANKYDLWMIDLYLPRWRYRPKKTWPLVERQLRDLSRQLSISLLDARPQPPTIEGQDWPHGKCFYETSPLIWFIEDGFGGSADNAWTRFDNETNARLAEEYGALSVAPLVDSLGKNCLGILAIHVEPDREKVLLALGALRSSQGKHRINNACIELNGLLAK